MSALAPRLAAVRAQIDDAARACGRDPGSVRLVAVSKGHPTDAIREAYGAGQRLFGESYAQELAAKASVLADLPELEWHFVGHLQTNKVRLVAETIRVIHSVDSTHLARALARRLGPEPIARLGVLVEVSVAGEAQKSGVPPQELEEVLAAVEREPALALRGLMTMPPFGDLAAAKRTFDTLVSLRSLHGGPQRLPELSMGMSGDLEIAVACGATLVRVGTSIFGPRGAGA